MKKTLLCLVMTFYAVLFTIGTNAQNLSTYNVMSASCTYQQSFNEPKVISVYQSNESFRRWWQTLLVDAAGALGGAASGAQFCKHWLCAAIGGVIGGAGASVARVSQSSGIYISKRTAPINPKNAYEMIGQKHNQIIEDFYEAYQNYNPDDLYTFIEREKVKYGVDQMPFSKEVYNELIRVSNKEYTSETEAIEGLKEMLSMDMQGKEEFISTVEKILGLSGIEEFNEKILQFEEGFYESVELSEKDIFLYQSFFSTMRHSANLWSH
jgi:hypothetical protein